MSRAAEPNPLSSPRPADDAGALEDEQWMARVAAGDETAFRLLVDRWERPVLSFLTRTLGDPEEARELSQETFLRVYRHAKRYRGQGRFRPWLFRIAGNLARSQLRRRKLVRWFSLDAEGPDQDPPAPHGDASDARVEALELGAAIQDCLSALPERQRMAFSLKRFEGLSYREIAEVLGCSPAAVESLLVRAMRQLQSCLRSKGYGDES